MVAETHDLLVYMVDRDLPGYTPAALRALQQAKLTNRIHIARDGEEALDYVFGEGAHAGRQIEDRPGGSRHRQRRPQWEERPGDRPDHIGVHAHTEL